jgi:hypothetical protein
MGMAQMVKLLEAVSSNLSKAKKKKKKKNQGGSHLFLMTRPQSPFPPSQHLLSLQALLLLLLEVFLPLLPGTLRFFPDSSFFFFLETRSRYQCVVGTWFRLSPCLGTPKEGHVGAPSWAHFYL